MNGSQTEIPYEQILAHAAVVAGIPRRFLDAPLQVPQGSRLFLHRAGKFCPVEVDRLLADLMGDRGIGGVVQLVGGPGTGKTSLASAIAVRALGSSKSVQSTTVDTSVTPRVARAPMTVRMTRLEQIRQVFSERHRVSIQRLRKVDLLVVDRFDQWADDIPGFLRVAIANVLSLRYEHGLATLLVGRLLIDAGEDEYLSGGMSSKMAVYYIRGGERGED